MTWNLPSRDVVVATPAAAMYALKEGLVAYGWTVLESGDGVAVYDPAGDCIASAVIMDQSRAWFRITDAGRGNELVVQRGSSGQVYWTVARSPLARFIGGVPDFQTIPTATDSQPAIQLVYNPPAGTQLFTTVANMRVNIGVQDAAHNGIYDFWMTCTLDGVGTVYCSVMHAATDSSIGSGDPDPVALMFANASPTWNYVCYAAAIGWPYPNNDPRFCGLFNGEYREFTGLLPNTTGFGIPLECHPDINSDYPMFPINLMRFNAQGAKPGWKGQLKYLRFNPVSTAGFGNIFKDGTTRYICFGALLLPGWPDDVNPVV
jgi:hypothetical protein